MLEQIKAYFEETDFETIQREWTETEKFDEVGPTVEEYLEAAEKFRANYFLETPITVNPNYRKTF